MNYQPLTVTKPQENGAVHLSDGANYLILGEHQLIAARWQTGQLIHVAAVLSRPGEFDLCAADAPSDTVRAKRVRS